MADSPQDLAALFETGQPVEASSSSVAEQDALRAAFESGTNDEVKYGNSEVAAFAAGAARGATLGLSDLALTKSGLVDPETLRGLQQANPVATVAGDVAGTVLPSLIPGVGGFTAGGLAARTAAAATRGAAKIGAGKIAARAAGAAAEGAFFGVGSAISEDVLEDGDLDLAGEKLLTHVGLGTVLGGAVGGGGAAIEKALSKTFRRVGARAMGAADDAADNVATAAMPGAEVAPGPRLRMPDIEDLPDDELIAEGVRKHAPTIKDIVDRLGLDELTPEKMVLRDLDITGAQMAKLKGKGVDKSAARAVLEDPRYVNAKTLDQKLSLIRSRQEEAAKAIGDSVSMFDEMAEAGEKLRPLDIANRIDEELIDPLKKTGNALNDPVVAQLRKQSKRLRQLDGATGGDGLSFREAEELKRSFDPFLKWDSQTPGPLQDKLRKLRGIINNEIENAVESVSIRSGSLEPLDAWKAAKRSYGEMAELEKHVAKRAAARDGNRWFSLTDYLAGGSALAAFAGDDQDMGDLAFAAGGALANKWGRERLAHVMALELNKLAKNKTAQVAAKSFANVFKKAEAAAASTPAATTAAGGAAAAAVPVAGFWTKYGPVLSTAAAKGTNALYATHIALSQGDPEYGEGVQMAGFRREEPEESRAGMRKASHLAAIQEAAAEHDRAVGEAVDGFLGSKGGGRVGVSRLSAKEYRKKLDELVSLTNNPEALVERLQGGATLANAAPNVASAVASAATRAVQFLHDKAPKNPLPPAMPGMERKWEPSDGELSKWSRYIRAVEEPNSVLEDMRHGTVTQEAVEALRAVYPKLAEDIQTRLTNAMAEGGKSLTYQQRMAVSALIGGAEPTTAPQTLQFLQSIHNQAQQQQQQRPPTTGQRIRVQDGATTSQRIEGKRS